MPEKRNASRFDADLDIYCWTGAWRASFHVPPIPNPDRHREP